MLDCEEDLLNKILEVLSGFKTIQKYYLEAYPEKYEKYDGDNQELVNHIHALQNWVLSNAAARNEPDKYRPFGCKFR